MKELAGEFWIITKETVAAWINDNVPSMGAAIAYYTLFSIAPLLIIATAIAGLFFGEEAARGEIFERIRGVLGQEAAIAVQGLVKSAGAPTKSFFALLTGILAMTIGATAVFAELQSAIDRIWRLPVDEQASSILGMVRARLLPLGMVLAVAFLLLLSLMVSAAISAMGAMWSAMLGGWELVLQIVNIIVSIVLMTSIFAMIYRFLPRVNVSWGDVWMGAMITALLIVVGNFFIGLYIGKSGVASSFGAAGAFVALLVWVYYSAQVFLLGAEFTRIRSHRSTARRRQNVKADSNEEKVANKNTH